MAGPDLDTELRRSAETATESVLSAARADAERIASEAERRIAERRQEVREGEEAAHRAEARVAIASERRTAMHAVLLARTRLVDRVLERARALLPEATQREAYRATLEAELAEALQFVDREGARVRCSVDLAGPVRAALRSCPEVTVEPSADIGAGFVVIGANQSVRVDGRLDTRMDRLASTLAIEIHARLEERSDG